MADPELVYKARNADLLAYLLSQGYNLIKSSTREYRIKEHDSLVISNNRWHWFSRNIGGNTLDFLIKYEGKTFNEAVEILTGKVLEIKTIGKENISIGHINHERNHDSMLILPPRAKDTNRVFAYLNKTRKIDGLIISDMIRQGKLYQSERDNCVFLGTDKDGNTRFACERGTYSGVSYRRDCPGSDKRFCFHIEGRNNTLYTSEAPIDALSHATLCKMQKIDYTKDHRISLGCLGGVALKQYLLDRPEIDNIILCLDNDKAGRAASVKLMKDLKEKGYSVKEEPSKLKDYNEDLLELVNIKNKNLSLTV